MTQTSPDNTMARAADWGITIVLICAQGLASLCIGFLSAFFMMISDGCHGEPDDPYICSDGGGAVFFGGLLLEWLLLAAGIVTSIVLAVRASTRGERAWTKPFIGSAVGLVGGVIMIVTIIISSS